MPTTDPIADFLTRIRNAVKARHRRVDIPSSSLKKSLAKILLDEKFISDFTVLDDGKQGILRINLKYNAGKPVIAGIQRVSKPGLRQYKKKTELPRVMGGFGVAIVSTSRGLMTDAKARQQQVGGEVMAFVW